MRLISKNRSGSSGNAILNPDSFLKIGYQKAREMEAASFSQLRQQFGAADYVDGFTIFDVGGNRYRIAAVTHYDKQRIYIRHVMTHSEYDRNAWRRA
jgi:mRNA interferase HigB